jgi:hypothetical protein
MRLRVFAFIISLGSASGSTLAPVWRFSSSTACKRSEWGRGEKLQHIMRQPGQGVLTLVCTKPSLSSRSLPSLRTRCGHKEKEGAGRTQEEQAILACVEVKWVAAIGWMQGPADCQLAHACLPRWRAGILCSPWPRPRGGWMGPVWCLSRSAPLWMQVQAGAGAQTITAHGCKARLPVQEEPQQLPTKKEGVIVTLRALKIRACRWEPPLKGPQLTA